MLAVRCRTGKSGTMSIHRPRDRCRHTPPPEPLWRLLHHRPQRLHALVRRALASSMIAIETVDRGRRLVCGQALQPERRYRRCLRDDPHMPRQASPVPAGSHPRASLHSASHTGAPLEHATVAHGPRTVRTGLLASFSSFCESSLLRTKKPQCPQRIFYILYFTFQAIL